MNRVLLKNFRIIDKTRNFFGSLIIENDIIKEIIPMNESGNELITWLRDQMDILEYDAIQDRLKKELAHV